MITRNTLTPDELSQLKNPAAAGILVYCESTGEFLLVKRNPKSRVYPDTWSIPCGESNVNEFESMDDCAKREFEEETTVSVPPNANLWCIDRYIIDERVFFIFIWRVKKKFFVKLDHEHTEVDWFTVDDLPTPISEQVLDAINRVV